MESRASGVDCAGRLSPGGDAEPETILIPPAGRAEFIVQAPRPGEMRFSSPMLIPPGPPEIPTFSRRSPISSSLSGTRGPSHAPKAPRLRRCAQVFRPGGAGRDRPAKAFFSEEFGGTNGPIQFYITVDGQKQKVFEPDEKPVITTKVGAVEDWTIENRALETHAFHIHQIHFRCWRSMASRSRTDLRDTIEIPYWEGTGTIS